MEKPRSLTVQFSFVQFTYWIAYCGINGYAAVYLQALGFDNFTLGIIMALGSIFAALLGPALATWLDAHPASRTADLILPLLGLELVFSVILQLTGAHNFFTAAIYSLAIAVLVATNSVNMRFCVDAVRTESALNFGIARGIGSFGYILPSVLLGLLFKTLSPVYLPLFILLFVLLQFAANSIIGRKVKQLPVVHTSGEKETGDKLIPFLRSEPRFSLLLLGSIFLFTAYETYAKFTINVVRNVGGDTGTMGILGGFTAAIEIPVLCCYFLFRKRWRASSLLRFAFGAFSLKALALALASTVPQLFLANTVQMISYAVYCSAIVDYVTEVIPTRNAAKAQSLVCTVTVVGVVLASLISGKCFDLLSVKTTMFICFLVSVVGSVLATAGVKCTGQEQTK